MQSTQSSGTVFFRGVVMLGFLGGIFYVALSGNALPDSFRKQIEKYLPKAIALGKSANAEEGDAAKANAGGEAPLYNAAKTASNADALPLMSLGNAEKSRSQNPAAPRKLAADNSATRLPTPSVNGSPGPVVPVNYQTPLDNLSTAAPRSNLEDIARKLNASLNPPAVNPFSEMQNRLKQLGATYYLLETWGNEQQYYRFYCKMAMGGNTDFTRCFESTDADPLAAMTAVLKQVEAWHGGGSTVR